MNFTGSADVLVRFSLVLGLSLPLLLFSQNARALETHTSAPLKWRELSQPVFLAPQDDIIYYSFTTDKGSKVHLVVANYKSGKFEFTPVLSATTQPVLTIAEKSAALAAINGGYFNLSDGISASYAVVNGKQVSNPRTNKALTGNPKLAPYLETIFNRSELRLLQDMQGKLVIQIAAHNSPVPARLKLIHSLQGGPQLLPQLTDKQEAFVRADAAGQVTDSIGVRRAAARTAFGITPDGYAMMVCVSGAGQDPESTGVSLLELTKILQDLGCVQAINFDGGASTSMVVKSGGDLHGNVFAAKQVCGKIPATRVKSVLLLQEVSQSSSQ